MLPAEQSENESPVAANAQQHVRARLNDLFGAGISFRVLIPMKQMPLEKRWRINGWGSNPEPSDCSTLPVSHGLCGKNLVRHALH